MIWFTIPQPPGWHNTMLISLGETRGLLLPKYPNEIQAGIVLKRGEWKKWRAEGIAAVAARVRRFDPMFKEFADGLTDFTPFFPLDAFIKFIDDWARDGLLLIGDAAHTMSPAGAIGVNVAIATAVVAAQEIFPAPWPRAVAFTPSCAASRRCARRTCGRSTRCSCAPRSRWSAPADRTA